MKNNPIPKFKVGDEVFVDGDVATVIKVIPPADRMFSEHIGYKVSFPLTN